MIWPATVIVGKFSINMSIYIIVKGSQFLYLENYTSHLYNSTIITRIICSLEQNLKVNFIGAKNILNHKVLLTYTHLFLRMSVLASYN
jgi:hypothetical protein